MLVVKKIAAYLAIAALLATVVVSFAGYKVNKILNQQLAVGPGGQIFEIHPGMTFTAISTALATQNIITRPEILTLYGRISGKAGKVRAGEYRIDSELTMKSLLEKFVTGNVVLHSFTIIEGWTFREMLAALAKHPAIDHSLAYQDWPDLLASLQAKGHNSDGILKPDTLPEGLFLPETYRFPKHTSDRELLRQAFGLMQATLEQEWNAKAPGLPLSNRYDALILASIVEKETARADERAKIAGVFVRRLQKGMRLQTDPTVIYGIGTDFNGNLTRHDLRTDTPYNTYTRAGLPPTPIALPGKASINAALHPADGNELYFVATGQADGSHRFSETKEQHDAAVNEFLVRQRSARREERSQ